MFIFVGGKNIFYLTYDENMHAKIYRCFNRLTKRIYIPRFSKKKIRRYIEHCPNYQFTQIKQHRPYGILMFIISPPQIFHTIAIDFVFALFGKFNVLFNVIDKFTKKIVLIPKKLFVVLTNGLMHYWTVY